MSKSVKKDWRISWDEYKSESHLIRIKKEKVDDWARMSLSGELSRKEIMTRVMMGNDANMPSDSYICMIYMCESYTFDVDFLKDLIYINSGLVLLGCWNDAVIDWVCELQSRLVEGSSSTGNAFKDVKKAVDEGYFEHDCPEYHEHLKGFLKEYNDLIKKLYSDPDEDTDLTDMNNLMNYYIRKAEIANMIKNYYIPVKDRLDWNAIQITSLLPTDFLKKHSKKVTHVPTKNVEDEDDDYIDKPDKPTRKYTTRHVKKVGRKAVMV